MTKKTYILKIIKTKKNDFIILSNLKGKLINYKSLKKKQTKDLKIKLMWGLVSLLRKLKRAKKKIKFIHLYVQNLKLNIIQYLFNILKIWNIQISFFKSTIPIPHNGCRLKHKSRKRKKGQKKNIIK